MSVMQISAGNVHGGVVSFFHELFERQQFATHLLENSFRSWHGFAELLLALALMLVTFVISNWLISVLKLKSEEKTGFFKHILNRVLWPIVMLLGAILAISLWRMLGYQLVWLQLLAMAARWMIVIRFVMAVLHGALPNQYFNASLERSLASVLWVGFVLWVSGVDTVLIEMLKNLAIPIGATKLSMYTVLTGIVSIFMVVVGALWLASMLDSKLMQLSKLDLNFRIVLSKIAKTVLVIAAVLIALPMVGIDLTVLSVFGGALGVGIGFGLQKIASNYISGFIILADRSIRIGDRLTVDNFTGYVTKITARFVVIRSASGMEALIPNDNFISSTVINESYSSKLLWTSLDVQVAYKTYLPKALEIMKQAAAQNPRVSSEPDTSPSSFLVEFADSGITLRVGFWLKDPENGFLGLYSQILLTIWQRFNEEGIEFPFPQREVRILNNPTETANLTEAAKQQEAVLMAQNGPKAH